MSTILTPNLEATVNAYNVGMAETFSWIPVTTNTDRPLFARASYITNLSDLSVNFTASNITIPAGIELADGDDPNIKATVVNLGSQGTALKVITQDLEASEDDITIGDRDGNLAKVDSQLNALQVVSVKKYGTYRSFNNSAKWVADNTLRPVFSFKKTAGGGNPLKLANYQLKCDSGVILYQWFEGDITIGGNPAPPGWSNIGNQGVYRIYQNTNTVVPGSAILRHSGIIGPTDSSLFNPLNEDGTTVTDAWTLCVKHTDNSASDLFFAVTLEEFN